MVFAHILSQKVRSAPFFETRVKYATVICVTALLFCYQGDKAKLSFRCFTRLGSKSLLHRVVHTKSVKELAEISCISLQSLTSSFRKIQIFKFAYLHFRCFIPCLGSKSLLYRVVHTKSVKRIGRDNLYIFTVIEELVSQNTDYRICIFCTSAVLFLALVIARRNLTVLTLHVQVYSFRFISQNTVSCLLL